LSFLTKEKSDGTHLNLENFQFQDEKGDVT